MVASSAEPKPEVPILANLSFEQLSQIQVASVSRREEKLSEVAAAVYVITGEDIRRSGVTSIPEALRLSPGVEVARLNSHRYAVSIRGFNGEFANKLLVLQDGRSLYTPLFAGTFWDVQDTMFEDIQQIEVVRGPGGTAWGANAVNGVINIITKDARETQGSMVTGGGGVGERAFGAARHGMKLSEHSWLRVYGSWFSRDNTDFASGSSAGDNWQQSRGGFRLDAQPSAQNHFTLQGETYGGHARQIIFTGPDVINMLGGHLIGRWRHTISESSDLNLQTYYDGTRRESGQGITDQDTFNFEGQHRFALGKRQEINWGLNYQHTQNRTVGASGLVYSSPNLGLDQAGISVDDTLTLVPEQLKISTGLKLEHNEFTGLEILPNARLSWTPSTRQTWWLAASRGVRIPSIADNDSSAVLNLPGPTTFQSLPNTALDAEVLWTYEAGWRMSPAQNLSLDVAVFFNDYDHLRTRERTISPGRITQRRGQLMTGESYGVELATGWQVTDNWRLRGSYTHLELELLPVAGSTDTASQAQEGFSPQHQFGFHSALDLPGNVFLDPGVRYVGALESLNVSSYAALDLRIAWRPCPQWELSVAAQNLLDDRHAEFKNPVTLPAASENGRVIHGKVTWRF